MLLVILVAAVACDESGPAEGDFDASTDAGEVGDGATPDGAARDGAALDDASGDAGPQGPCEGVATTVLVDEDITEDTQWCAAGEYRLDGIVSVREGATLTIEAGTRVLGGVGGADRGRCSS
ncbi:MAG: hypothetical protein AAF447_10845 [Myxococcota bacterium]